MTKLFSSTQRYLNCILIEFNHSSKDAIFWIHKKGIKKSCKPLSTIQFVCN
jgi:hypothetical protein